MSGMPVPPLGAARAFAQAARACAAHASTFAFAVLFFAALSVPLHFVAGWLDLPTGMQDQSALVKLILTQFAVTLGLETLSGPLFGAMAVYVGWRFSKGQPGGLYGAVNFALGRFGRLVGWYFVVTLCVQVGLQLVVVPGVLFYLMYAFVVPVLCLEDEKWPLARSKKLTMGRRRSIFLLFLPGVVLEMGLGLMDFGGVVQGWLEAALGTPAVPDAALALAWYGLEAIHVAYEFVMVGALYFLYADRVSRAKPASTSAAVG